MITLSVCPYQAYWVGQVLEPISSCASEEDVRELSTITNESLETLRLVYNSLCSILIGDGEILFPETKSPVLDYLLSRLENIFWFLCDIRAKNRQLVDALIYEIQKIRNS